MSSLKLLPYAYPAGASLQEKLSLGVARTELARLFDRLTALIPIEFASDDDAPIAVQLAMHECVERDASTLARFPEAIVNAQGEPTLSLLARGYLGNPTEGFYAGLSCLPWLRVRVPDPAVDWADALWQAGARDYLFADRTGKVFAVISDDHDHEVSVIGAEAAELVGRAAGRSK